MESMGIRGRIGRWSWDAFDAPMAAPTDQVIATLRATLERYPTAPDKRIAAWPILIGHYTCTDALWQAAKAIADEHEVGLAFHMSPVANDPDWFIANKGRRPFEHLAELGVLGRNIVATHAVHLNGSEVSLLGQAGASVAHCPMTTLRGAYGGTTLGKFPELVAAGVTLALGSDGSNDSNTADLHRAMFLLSGLSKDARRDPTLFPAHEALEHATLAGAQALGMETEIGSLEVGKKADFVLHDIDRPEWRPLLNVVNQLVWSADGRSVHSVWVDGVRVVDSYRSTIIDEERLFAEVEAAGRRLMARAGLPYAARWPTL
jgi:5-methylthioadenosine/S-adenosylhomocysteine deaminase